MRLTVFTVIVSGGRCLPFLPALFPPFSYVSVYMHIHFESEPYPAPSSSKCSQNSWNLFTHLHFHVHGLRFVLKPHPILNSDWYLDVVWSKPLCTKKIELRSIVLPLAYVSVVKLYQGPIDYRPLALTRWLCVIEVLLYAWLWVLLLSAYIQGYSTYVWQCVCVCHNLLIAFQA